MGARHAVAGLLEKVRRHRDPPAGRSVHLSPGEIAALIASVASVTSVGPDISATARSALTRLIEALQPGK